MITPEEFRRRLVEIDDEMRALPDDAFAEKFRLGQEADEIRRALEHQLRDDLDAASADWAERAGRKGLDPAIADSENQAQAGLASPIDN